MRFSLTAPHFVTNYIEMRRARLPSGCPQCPRSKRPQNTHNQTATNTPTHCRRCQQHATTRKKNAEQHCLSLPLGLTREHARLRSHRSQFSQLSDLSSSNSALFVGDTDIKGNCRRSFPAQT